MAKPRRKYEIRERYVCSDGSMYYVNAHTEREKKKKIAERERKIREGTIGKSTYSNNTRIKDVALKWVDLHRTEASDEYKANIKSRIKTHILPVIGNKTFAEFDVSTLQQFVNDISEKEVKIGKRSEHPISNGYARKIYDDLFFLFSCAVIDKIIPTNPMKHVKFKKGAKQIDRRAATDEEIELLKKAASKDERFVFFLVMLYCGLRNSEVSRLKQKDIITINGTPCFDVDGTKSESAKRKVPIPNELLVLLPKRKKDEYLFQPNEGRLTNSTRLDSSAQTRLWKACKREMNILAGCKLYRNQLVPPLPVAEDLTPYCLRHSYATSLHYRGVPLDYRKYLLGHSSIQQTIDIYTHLGLGTIDELLKTIDINSAIMYGSST